MNFMFCFAHMIAAGLAFTSGLSAKPFLCVQCARQGLGRTRSSRCTHVGATGPIQGWRKLTSQTGQLANVPSQRDRPILPTLATNLEVASMRGLGILTSSFTSRQALGSFPPCLASSLSVLLFSGLFQATILTIELMSYGNNFACRLFPVQWSRSIVSFLVFFFPFFCFFFLFLIRFDRTSFSLNQIQSQ